ncbi:hypothetical protein BS50DRAFT_580853 [Corynespora cassiicola Philippines]|uniref:F-box domain-containing protein n=1 Tax=Corynespora cassiicola Philippines TaxID=1448308 RepID=A0A2T2P8L6_CORCC|nr:hypothetical protein BS50DRAFT_580853 [Corynespora cassiicola Philippines]
MASHTLLTLPHEMFHEIMKNIKGLKNDCRASLINLGNTCRHFRGDVLEILLSSPIVDINKIPLLVYTYWEYPQYLSKAKFLEVQEKPLREKDWIDCFPLENLLPYCEDIINKTGIQSLPKRIWR